MDKQLQKQLITEIMNDDAKDGLYKQQTAVEWLMEQITYEDDGKRLMSFIEYADLTEFFTKAKQMEREQIINAWLDGLTKDELQKIAANKYYTQTYGE